MPVPNPAEGDGIMILQECPTCHRQQKLENKKCLGTLTVKDSAGNVLQMSCPEDLAKAKRSGRLRYWITYRLPSGKQKKEFAGDSLSLARDCESKRKVQKREGKILEYEQQQTMTFAGLERWYLELSQVETLASFSRVCGCFRNFNVFFGETKIMDLKQADLSEYQTKRAAAGRSVATIDMEIKIIATALRLAESNDMISADSLKPFKRVKRLLRTGDNARGRVLSFEEIRGLLDHAAKHLKPIILKVG